MLYLRFLFNLTLLSDAWKILKALFKTARTRAAAVRTAKGVILPISTWPQRFWTSLLAIVMVADVADFVTSIVSKGSGLGFLAFAKIWPDHASDMIETAAQFIVGYEPLAARLAGTTMSQILGTKITTVKPNPTATAEERRIEITNLGGEFAKVVGDVFSVSAAQQDFSTRTGFVGSLDNLAAFFGLNLTFQLRSLTIGTVASLTGIATLRHLENLHQSVSWAFGIGWLSWAVMSEYMNVTVSPGIRRLLLSQVRPNDMSEGEAYNAFIQGRIDFDTRLQILDNLGIRRDIRDVTTAMREKDFDEQDVTVYFQRGWITAQDVFQWARWRGFPVARAKLKQRQIENARIWEIIEKVSNAYSRLYRDCVIPADQLRAWYKTINWNDQEIDTQIALMELERNQRKWLTISEHGKAIEFGLETPHEAWNDLLCQGMTQIDALIAIMLEEIKHLPPDCLDKIKPGDIAGALKAIFALLGIGGIVKTSGSLIKLFECIGGLPIGITPPPGPPPGAEKPPQISFTILPGSLTAGDETRVIWDVRNAETVIIEDPAFGQVPLEGVRFIRPTQDVILKLVAVGKGGTEHKFASALVHAAPPPRPLHAAPRPTVSLAVSPGRIDEGEEYEVRWASSNADEALLDDGSGPRKVAINGALIITADKSRIYTLTVAGPGGQRSATDSVIVRPPRVAEGKVPPPSVSLSVSPGRAHPGDPVEIRWNSSNATRLTLAQEASTQEVAPAGALVMVAQQTMIVTLTATGPGGTRLSADALIVIPLVPAPELDKPHPSVTLSLRPAATRAGGTVAVEWSSHNVTTLTLLRGGERRVLALVGAETLIATTSEVIVLEGTGPGGHAAVARVLIVR